MRSRQSRRSLKLSHTQTSVPCGTLKYLLTYSNPEQTLLLSIIDLWSTNICTYVITRHSIHANCLQLTEHTFLIQKLFFFFFFFFFFYFFFRAGIIYTKSTMMLCQDKHYIHSIQMLK